MIKKKEQKSALITGATSGIGKASVLRLAQEGYNIFMVARRGELLEELKEQISSSDIKVEFAVGDVTDEEFSIKAMSRAYEIFGSLNVLVLSAGCSFMKPYNLTSTSDYRQLIDVNLFGVINFCKNGIKYIPQNGSIILFTSPAGIRGAKGMSAYAVSKAGVVAFGKCLALEVSVKNIRVNIISPGYVETEMTEKLYNRLNKIQIKRIKDSHPLGVGSAIDIANAVSFLASDESSWITGNILEVDGGFAIGGS
jgi:3-oxoacyl-[acyl-carrier protein] reductase